MQNKPNLRTPNSAKKPMVKIGGLFENVSATTGETFFTGRFGYGARIMVVKNPDKTADSPTNVPHWNILVYETDPAP